MPIKILMAIPTLNQYDLRLSHMLSTLESSTLHPDRILIVDNGHRWHSMHYANEIARSFPLDVFTPHANLGVAGSVNYALRNTPEDWFYLHANDDVELDRECLAKMAAAAVADPYAFIIPEHGEGSAFTVFLVHSGMRDRVGYLDEVFFPGYFEDGSYGRRLNIAGVKRVIVKGAAYVHHTSSTLKSYDKGQEIKHHEDFRRNAQEYERMWGGPPDKETFQIPYNGRFWHSPNNISEWAVYESPKEKP